MLWRLRRPKKAAPPAPAFAPPVQDDHVELTLPGLAMALTRRLNIEVPHEVTVVIPRAEIRIRDQEVELIYSSITIVHAPRHPLAGELPPGGEGLSPTPSSPGEAPASPAGQSPLEGSRSPGRAAGPTVILGFK